jgi:hypothetical protein
MHDCIFFSMTNQWILLLTVFQTFGIIGDTPWKSVESGAADFAIFTHNDATHLGGWIF